MKYVARMIEILLPVAAIVLVAFQVIVSNELTALGKQVGKLDAEVRIESDIKETLAIQVASASSLLTLREKAIALGFIEPTTKQIVNLTRETPVALDTSLHLSLQP